MAESERPHAVCIPFPAQSHAKPMMKLAKLLHHKGFHITFVHTEHNQNQYKKAGGFHSDHELPNFSFETIPDGLPPVSNTNEPQRFPSLCGSIRRSFLSPFRDLLRKLNVRSAEDSNSRPVTCIVCDGLAAFAVTAAQELGIPVVSFWTYPACAFMSFSHYQDLLDKGLAPLEDKSDNLETVIDWIPGMKDIRVKNLPAIVCKYYDPNEEIFNMMIESAEKAREASAVALNTFDALEEDVVNALRAIFPSVYTIGPLPILLNRVLCNHDQLDSVGYNLWKEDRECIQWLNSKEPSSVVYVNFGSFACLTLQQLVEFSWGLARTKYYFMLIIRPDLLIGESRKLPEVILEEIKERGKIASWCPQEEVLKHPSVGVFLTHSGWNSTIESLSAGVPMICWPCFSDQPTIRSYVCGKWEVGVEIDQDVRREQVEKLVREMMEGEEGRKMKKKAREWKKQAEEATSLDGSSSLNLGKLVNVLLSQPMYRTM